jgi:hypothetical protein
MILPFHFHTESFLPFISGSILFFLSSRYFGGVYVWLARFWFILFFLDFVMLIINSFTLRYSLNFNRNHINKGDRIQYTVLITGEGKLPVPLVKLEFTRIHIKTDQQIEPVSFSLLPGKVWKYQQEVYAEIRGVYTMGVSRLSLTGLTGLITIDLPIWSRTFYVYPKIFDIPKIIQKHRSSEGHSLAIPGRRGDSHIFHSLREYRTAESIRNISWSRFIQTGTPYIKSYNSRGGSDIHLFLDRRHSGRSSLCDDTVLEVFLCMIYSGIHTGQRLILHGYPGWENRTIETRKEFNDLYLSTLLMEFDALDLGEIRDIPPQDGLYIVTGLPDYKLLDEHYRGGSIDHLITVTQGRPADELLRIRTLIMNLRLYGTDVTELPSSGTVRDDMLCQLYS